MEQSIPTTVNEEPSMNFTAGRNMVIGDAPTPAGLGPSTMNTIQSELITPRPVNQLQVGHCSHLRRLNLVIMRLKLYLPNTTTVSVCSPRQMAVNRFPTQQSEVLVYLSFLGCYDIRNKLCSLLSSRPHVI